MTDGQLLLIVLGAFTFYECLRWVPARAWIFQALGNGKWRDSRPWELFRTRGGALAQLMPVPPLEPHVITAAWACAPHEGGLCVWDDESGAAKHVPWDQVRPLAEGAVLHLTPEHRVRCVHATSAKAWAKLVTEWAKQTQVQRRQGFLKQAKNMLSEKPLMEAAESLQMQTQWLRRIGGWLFFWCFLFLPVIYWRFADTWPSLAAIGVMFALAFTQAFLLMRQVRRDVRLREDAVQHILSAALFPPASMRAADWVCSCGSPETHPLAALKVWGTDDALHSLAARLWREARWPLGEFPERPWDGPEVEALRGFFESSGIKLEALEAAPMLPEGCTHWCPRCLTPYQEPTTECADCGGTKLL